MKDFGSLTELTFIQLRATDGKQFKLSSTTGAAADLELRMPTTGSTPDFLVSRSSTDTGTGRLKNKDLEATSLNLVDGTDTTKKLVFDTSGSGTGTTVTLATPSGATTKTYTLPSISANDRLLSRTSTDSATNRLQNKDLDIDTTRLFENVTGSTISFVNTFSTGRTVSLSFQDNNGTFVFPSGSTNLVGDTTTQTLSNKTLDNSTTANLKDSLLRVQAAADATKQAAISASAVTAGQTRTVTWPNFNLTLPAADGSSGQALTTNGSGVLSFSSVLTNPMTTAGDLIYGGGAGAPTRLAAGTSSQVLHSGTTPSWGAVSLTADVSGTLPIANGGTNLTTYTTGDTLYASASNVLSKLTVGSTGDLLTVTAGVPAWSSTIAGAKTFSGNLIFSQSAGALITDTTDGSDNKRVDIGGGGAAADSRGALLQIIGNENASNAGCLRLFAGNVGGAQIQFINAGTTSGTVDASSAWFLGGAFDVTHAIENSSTTTDTLLVRNQNSTSSSDSVSPLNLRKGSTTNTTSQRFVHFNINAGGTDSGYITANGANAATFTSSSDYRLKENIAELPSQLPSIMALRPVEFDYKDGSGHQIGFIAQEVQTIYPDCVSENPDTGYLLLGGWSKTEARLVKALQELKKQFDDYVATHP